jgi:probable rRNA maturation factor
MTMRNEETVNEPPERSPGVRRPGEPSVPEAVHIEIVDRTRRLSSDTLGWLERQSARAIGLAVAACGCGCPGGEVRVCVLGDRAISELHGRTHGDPTPTDVLTFDLGAGTVGRGPLDVDIVVGLEVAERQAAERGHGVEQELLLYILHGTLHGLGHDDQGDAAYAAMHAEEDRILELLGVGATFARPAITVSRGGSA